MKRIYIMLGAIACLALCSAPAGAQVKKGGFGGAVAHPGGVHVGGHLGLGHRVGVIGGIHRGPLSLNSAAFFRHQQLLEARRLQAFQYGRVGLGVGYGGLGYDAGYYDPTALVGGIYGGIGSGYGGAGGIYGGSYGGSYGLPGSGIYGGSYGGMLGTPSAPCSGGGIPTTYGAPSAGYSKTIIFVR